MSFFDRKILSPQDALEAIYDELDQDGTLDEHVAESIARYVHNASDSAGDVTPAGVARAFLAGGESVTDWPLVFEHELIEICCYASPIDCGSTGITPEQAQEIAQADRGLIYIRGVDA